MNMKILTLLTAILLLTPFAMADSKPFTVNFVTQPSSTTFSVQTKTAELNFSAPSGAGLTNPEGGNPWGNITNEANIPLSFSVKVDSEPTNITFTMGSVGSGQGADTVDVVTTAHFPTGWQNVPSNGKVNIVAFAIYGLPTVVGTESKILTIEGAVPS